VDCIDWVAICFEYYAEVGDAATGNSIPPGAAHQINFTIKEPFESSRSSSLQLPAAPDRVEGGSGARGREHGGMQASPPEPLSTC
jgi:hypothetical protein